MKLTLSKTPNAAPDTAGQSSTARSGQKRHLRSGLLSAATVALALPALLATTAGAATAPDSRAAVKAHAGEPVPTVPSSGKPASVGPGILPAPGAVPAAAMDVCAEVAFKAGFPLDSYVSTSIGWVRKIVIAVAVALAESSCNSSIYLCNPSLQTGIYPPVNCPSGTTSEDRGLWQINSYYHSNVSDACAFTGQCNADAAWSISTGGSNWSPWTTYTSGAWANYAGYARSAIGRLTVTLINQGTGKCLAADAQAIGNGHPIWQWHCGSTNIYEQWHVIQGAGNLNPVLQNAGTGTCLDTQANQQNYVVIFQWTCNPTGDTRQRWSVLGSGGLNANAAALALLKDTGNGTCLAADASQAYDRGLIWQWGCSGFSYLQWN